MAGIADAMSKLTSGKRAGGIADGMEGGQRPKERAEAQDQDGVESHLKALHDSMGGKHMHVHQHEGGYTSHQVGDDGKVDGPHDHENMEALKEHMNRFLSEEEQDDASHSEHDDGCLM